MSRILTVLVGVGLSVSSAAAQQVPDSSTAHHSSGPAAGQRVRITSSAHRLDHQVGTVIGSVADSITVRIGSGHTLSRHALSPETTLVLARGDIDRLELSRGLHRNTGRGALIGLGAGAATGVVIGFATYQECVPQSFLDCLYAPESPSQQAMILGVALGILGAGVGALVGSAKQERWERVATLDDVAPSARPLRSGRLGVGVEVAF